jgi:hypothetical protein
MKIDIKNVSKKQGTFRKREYHGVELTVNFNEQEKAIIKERQLESHVIMDRSVPADMDPEKIAKKAVSPLGIASTLAKAVIKGTDSLSFNLTITKLLKGPDTYYVGDILTSKNYIEEIKESMKQLKFLIEASEVTAEDTSFEL